MPLVSLALCNPSSEIMKIGLGFSFFSFFFLGEGGGVSFVFPACKVLFLIIIVSAFQSPKITSRLINSPSNFSHRKYCSIHSKCFSR